MLMYDKWWFQCYEKDQTEYFLSGAGDSEVKWTQKNSDSVIFESQQWGCLKELKVKVKNTTAFGYCLLVRYRSCEENVVTGIEWPLPFSDGASRVKGLLLLTEASHIILDHAWFCAQITDPLANTFTKCFISLGKRGFVYCVFFSRPCVFWHQTRCHKKVRVSVREPVEHFPNGLHPCLKQASHSKFGQIWNLKSILLQQTSISLNWTSVEIIDWNTDGDLGLLHLHWMPEFLRIVVPKIA